MPLIRRIPKRGFNNSRHATVYIPVNLAALEAFEAGSTVDEAVLRQAGLVNGRAQGVKILGGGQLTKRLIVRADAFSASARAKIVAMGGSCETPAAPTAPAAPAS